MDDLTTYLQAALRTEPPPDTVTEADVAALWQHASLGDVLLVDGALGDSAGVLSRALRVMDLVLRSDVLAGKTPAAKKRASLLQEVRDAAAEHADKQERLLLLARLESTRANNYELQGALQAGTHLLRVVSELTAPSNQRFSLASSARMVGKSAERACGEATAALAEALKAEVPAPSVAVLQDLAARSVWPVNLARDPLHALVLAMLHGPEPLAALLEGSDWTDASLARAWREAIALEVVLPLAAMGCSAAETSFAVQKLLESWQPAPELVPARALRALQQDRAAFVRAHAVYIIACRAPSDVSLTTVVREALPASAAEELYGWLQLFAEASQAGAARSLKSLLG